MTLQKDSFANLVTFTRASTGYYFDASGVVQSAAVDAVRFDHDPDTGTARGILVEEARTNELTDSNDFSASSDWSGDRDFTITTATSIFSGETAYSLENKNLSVARSRIESAGTLTASAETYSVILENVDAVKSGIGFYDLGAPSGWVVFGELTWSGLGAVVSFSQQGTSTSVTVEDWGTGPNGGQLVRLTVTGTPVNSGNRRSVYIYPSGTSQNGETVVVHHAQHEKAAFVSSPIVTTTSAVTRAADRAVLSATALAAIPATEGAIATEVKFAGDSGQASGARGALAIGADGSNRMLLYNGSGENLFLFSAVGGVAQARISTGVSDTGQFKKTAMAYKANDYAITSDGNIVATDTSGTVPPTISAGRIGATVPNSAGGNAGMWIKNIVFYPTRLSNTDLEALSGT